MTSTVHFKRLASAALFGRTTRQCHLLCPLRPLLSRPLVLTRSHRLGPGLGLAHGSSTTMRLLLDTLTILWWQRDDAKLGQAARRAIGAAEVVFVSPASAWELVIKSALGKVTLPVPFGMVTEDSGFTQLPISLAHVATLSALPPYHADAFDRILIAQALSEQLTLVSHDRQFALYGVPIIWA